MNVTKLEETLDHIRCHREEHDQIYWAMKTECGTTMCFAGTAVALAGYELSWARADKTLYIGDLDSAPPRRKIRVADSAEFCVVPGLGNAQIHDSAAQILDLTPDQATRLFHKAKTFDDVERTVKDFINEQSLDAC